MKAQAMEPDIRYIRQGDATIFVLCSHENGYALVSRPGESLTWVQPWSEDVYPIANQMNVWQRLLQT